MLRYLLLLLLLLSSCALTSCRTPRYIPMPETHSRDSLSTRVNKYVDSTIIDRNHTEKLHRGSDRLAAVCSFRVDTLLVKDSIYIEKRRYISLHDTITITTHDSIPYPVEVQSPPRQKPLLPSHREDDPRFYRTCTLGFFLLLLALLAYTALRIYFRKSL